LSLAAYSYVRIVRLSFVEGDVQVARPNSAGPARGLANLPLEHNATVETTNGVAEIEFEQEAFARLAPHSRLHLAELGLLTSGNRVTRLFLAEGTATFEAHLSAGDTFMILTPHFQVTVPEQAVLRVDLGPEGNRVRVFQGEVRVEAAANTLQLSAGQMLEWRPASAGSAEGEMLLTRNPEPDAWDEWNQQRRQVARALLNYQTPLSGATPFSTHWYTRPYSFSFCGGWNYHPFTGWWTLGRGGFFDPFYGWTPSSWYTAGYPGCATPWYWQYGRGVIPRSPVSPGPTTPPASGTAAPATDVGERIRFDPNRDRPERPNRTRRPGWDGVFGPRQPDLHSTWPGRSPLPVVDPEQGESLPTAEETPAGGAPAVSERPQPVPPPSRERGVDRPDSVRPAPSPTSRVTSRPSRQPAARPPAARSPQVRSSPSRSTPRPSRPSSRPPRPPKP